MSISRNFDLPKLLIPRPFPATSSPQAVLLIWTVPQRWWSWAKGPLWSMICVVFPCYVAYIGATIRLRPGRKLSTACRCLWRTVLMRVVKQGDSCRFSGWAGVLHYRTGDASMARMPQSVHSHVAKLIDDGSQKFMLWWFIYKSILPCGDIWLTYVSNYSVSHRICKYVSLKCYCMSDIWSEWMYIA